ncbi:hypothetical protein ACRCHC_21240 [Enterobacter hormaechei]|uniref:hypothetical protein n=1 Tax=Enterobacter hormaechei TaxID=158836 RepID=UPI003D6BD697
MPPCGIKAQPDVVYGTVCGLRRDPAQPVALLIGSANPSPSLLSYNPLTAMKNV